MATAPSTWPSAVRVPCAGSAAAGEVCVPGGAYWMGNAKLTGEGTGDAADRLRLVVVPPFFLDATEVTVGRVRAAGATPDYTFSGDATGNDPPVHRAIGMIAMCVSAVFANFGRLGAARELARVAEGAARRSIAAAPDSADARHALALSLNRSGDIAALSGDLRAARSHYAEALAIARTLAADDVWLSTAYERPTVTISVHQDVNVDDEPYFRACEEIFDAYNGRPHWGKVNYLDGETLSQRHPRWRQASQTLSGRNRRPRHHQGLARGSAEGRAALRRRRSHARQHA